MSWTAIAWGAVIAFILGLFVWIAIACLGALFGAIADRLGRAMLKIWRSGRL